MPRGKVKSALMRFTARMKCDPHGTVTLTVTNTFTGEWHVYVIPFNSTEPLTVEEVADYGN